MFNQIKEDIIKTITNKPIHLKDQIDNKQLFINSILKLQEYDYVAFQLRTIYVWLKEEDINMNQNIIKNISSYLKSMVEDNQLIIKTVEDNKKSMYKTFSFVRESMVYNHNEEILSKPNHVTGMSLYSFKRDVRAGLSFPVNQIYVDNLVGFI